MKSRRKQFRSFLELSDHDLHLTENRLQASENEGPLWEQSLAERYVRGDVGFHLHIVGRIGNNERGEYCIATQNRIIDDVDSGIRSDARVFRSGPFQAEMHGDGGNDGEQLVFVGIVEDANRVQSRIRWVRGVERLAPLNECFGFRAHPADASNPVGPPTLSRYEGGKLSLRIVKIASRETPRDVVKGGPKIVDTVINKQTPSLGGDIWRVVKSNNEQLVFWIVDNNSISFHLKEGIHIGFEHVEMVLCPTKFGVAVVKSHIAEAVNKS